MDMELSSKSISNLQDGAEIVKGNANYGFIIESVQADAILKTFCQLDTVLGADLGQRHYALAFPKGSTIREKVSKQILKYVENGDIYRLKNKWKPRKNCSSSTENHQVDEISNVTRALPFCKSNAEFKS